MIRLGSWFLVAVAACGGKATRGTLPAPTPVSEQTQRVTVSHDGKNGAFNLIPWQSEYESGRPLNERDITEHRNVCVVGVGLREQLYGTDVSPLGTFIKINGVDFEIVGVMKTPGAANNVFVPASVAKNGE